MNDTGTECARPESQLSCASSLFSLTPREYAAIADFAREEFGLELGSGKQQLAAARVGKLMRKLGLTSFRDFFRHVQSNPASALQLIDALTTNHTSFFREEAHFDFLVDHIFSEPRGREPMRIWSAACSSGEEPYTIALMAREYMGRQDRALPRILATDISTRVLDVARSGMYKAECFHDGLAPWMKRHLLRGENQWEGWYRMRPEIMAMVEFQRLNLIEPLPDLGRFAVIFCRNVMIYFSRTTQEGVVNQLAACLDPGGYLFVGHSESLAGMQHGLQQIQPAIYRKRGGKI